MRRSGILSLAAATIAASFLGVPEVRADNSVTVAQGRQLFMSNNCYECHGTVGQGGAGPTIAPPHLPVHSKFTAFVRNPSPPNMPPYTAAVLDDDDLSAIWTYLNSLPPPNSTLPEPLARLQQSTAH